MNRKWISSVSSLAYFLEDFLVDVESTSKFNCCFNINFHGLVVDPTRSSKSGKWKWKKWAQGGSLQGPQGRQKSEYWRIEKDCKGVERRERG